MAKRRTFIKLDRNILQWRWYKNANTMRVFLHLILTANVYDCAFDKIIIHRGELVTSYERLSQELGLSNQQIRTTIQHLKSTGELTVKRYPKYQVISIVNYALYQDKATVKTPVNQRANNNQITVNQQQYKNNKEYIKKEKEDNGQAPLNAALPEDWLTAPLTEEQVAGLTPEQMIARRDMARE